MCRNQKRPLDGSGDLLQAGGRRERQLALSHPESTTTSEPVVFADRGEARTTASAIS
jgi:hypothetical protein